MKKLLYVIGTIGVIFSITVSIIIAIMFDNVDVANPNGEVYPAICGTFKENSNCTSAQLTYYSLTQEELTDKSGRYEEKFATFNEVYDRYLDKAGKVGYSSPFILGSNGTVLTREELFASYFNRNTGNFYNSTIGDVKYNKYGLTFYNFLAEASERDGVSPVLINDGTKVAYMDGTDIASVQPLAEAPDFVQKYLTEEPDELVTFGTA